METEAFQSLLNVLKLDCAELAARLGGREQHYQRLLKGERLPFAVWDALQRLAYRSGYAWDPKASVWCKAGVAEARD